MTSRIATWLFAAALGVVSIGCQPADEPVTDTAVDVDMGEPADSAADSNTTTTVIESPEVTELPEVTEPETTEPETTEPETTEPESTGLELPPADEPVVEEEPATEPAETEE